MQPGISLHNYWKMALEIADVFSIKHANFHSDATM